MDINLEMMEYYYDREVLADIPEPQIPWTPERKLCYAMLIDAYNLYCRLSKWTRSRRGQRARSDISGQRLLDETARWVNSESDLPFSFEFVCAHLNLHSDMVRKGFKRGAKQLTRGWHQTTPTEH